MTFIYTLNAPKLGSLNGFEISLDVSPEAPQSVQRHAPPKGRGIWASLARAGALPYA